MIFSALAAATLLTATLASPVIRKRDDCDENSATKVDAVTGSLSSSALPTYPGGYQPLPWAPSGYSGTGYPRAGTAGTSSSEGSPITASNSMQPSGASPNSTTFGNGSFSETGPSLTIETITVTLPPGSGTGGWHGTGTWPLPTYGNGTYGWGTASGTRPASSTTRVTSFVTVPQTTTITLSNVPGSSSGMLPSGNITSSPSATENSPITASGNSSTPCATGHSASTKTLTSTLVSTINSTISIQPSGSGSGSDIPGSSTSGSPITESNSTAVGSSTSAPRQGSLTTVTVTITPSYHPQPHVTASNGTISISGTSPYSSGTVPVPWSTISFSFTPVVPSGTAGSSGSTPGSPVTGSSPSQSEATPSQSSFASTSEVVSGETQTLTLTLTTSSSGNEGRPGPSTQTLTQTQTLTDTQTSTTSSSFVGSGSAESRTGEQSTSTLTLTLTSTQSMATYSAYTPTGTGPPIVSSPSKTEGSPVTGSVSSTLSTSTISYNTLYNLPTAHLRMGEHDQHGAYVKPRKHRGAKFRHRFYNPNN